MHNNFVANSSRMKPRWSSSSMCNSSKTTSPRSPIVCSANAALTNVFPYRCQRRMPLHTTAGGTHLLDGAYRDIQFLPADLVPNSGMESYDIEWPPALGGLVTLPRHFDLKFPQTFLQEPSLLLNNRYVGQHYDNLLPFARSFLDRQNICHQRLPRRSRCGINDVPFSL